MLRDYPKMALRGRAVRKYAECGLYCVHLTGEIITID